MYEDSVPASFVKRMTCLKLMMGFGSLVVQGERLGEANSVVEAMDVLVVNEAAADCECGEICGSHHSRTRINGGEKSLELFKE